MLTVEQISILHNTQLKYCVSMYLFCLSHKLVYLLYFVLA